MLTLHSQWQKRGGSVSGKTLTEQKQTETFKHYLHTFPNDNNSEFAVEAKI